MENFMCYHTPLHALLGQVDHLLTTLNTNMDEGRGETHATFVSLYLFSIVAPASFARVVIITVSSNPGEGRNIRKCDMYKIVLPDMIPNLFLLVKDVLKVYAFGRVLYVLNNLLD
jgi:hypothetical protein